MAPAPRVSAVILNYNLAAYTIECVRSLQRVAYPSLETLVLDNASTGDDAGQISAAVPGVQVRSAAHNTGYTGGINAGVRWAMEGAPDYILVLNPDTEVQPDFLGYLVGAMETHPRAAVACGTIYTSHRPQEVWYAGGRMFPWRGLAVHEGKGTILPPEALGEPRPVTFVTGCLALYRASALERIGGQDERFFLYLDDIEMSARITRKGFGLLYVPKAVIRHHVKGEAENPFKLYYSVRNRLLLIRTAFSGLPRLTASLYFAAVIGAKMLVWLVANREFFRAAAMGMEDYLRGRFGEGRGLQAYSPRGEA